MSREIYCAKQSFSIRWNGHPLVVHTGSTVREGHPLLEAYPSLFVKLVPDFEYTPPPPSPPPSVPTAPRKATPPSPPVKKVAAAPVATKTEEG